MQDNYSGLLIEPTAQALYEATLRLQRDPELRLRLGRHAREVAETFGLDRWRNGWSRVIHDVLGSPAP